MAARRRGRGRTGKAVAGAAIALAAAAAVAAALGVDLRSFLDQPEAEATTETPATAEVVRQTLTETVAVAGDLGYGDALDMACLLNGTLTGLPAAGDVLERGDVLYSVDDAPVVLLYGSLPAYRTLAVGAEGADVKQLEKNLSKLGYDGFTVDDEFTDATADAVEQWQDHLGVEETGRVDLGRVVFTPAAIRVDTVEPQLGSAAQPGAAAFTYTGLDKVVTVEVELDDQELVVVGDPVAITLPDGTEATGTVTASETAVTEETGQGGETEDVTYLDVTVAADDAAVFDALDQASVDVGFSGESAPDVLTVPVEALLGLAEGGYGVELVDGDTTEVVAVETGLFADGYVEVSGEGLEAGQAVVVPS
ncbi:Putative peptidoglycan binding domain-containing protein [Glycomyces sambucus]|uniref:Putative peptidoglycan binding domain-containing protein n=1 Tax=Glycomyces sambucus TaxID=380244 RepID=A0A1G9JB22_9ACTN|nr:peptidoglycan-binding protein [Glycomyces sambucus]SDL34648.1 Putative peptidoglycan binding domain-containing protein [Glycomyces sambucus]